MRFGLAVKRQTSTCESMVQKIVPIFHVWSSSLLKILKCFHNVVSSVDGMILLYTVASVRAGASFVSLERSLNDTIIGRISY